MFAEAAKEPAKPVKAVAQDPFELLQRPAMDQPVFLRQLVSKWGDCLHSFSAKKFPEMLVDLGSLQGLKISAGLQNVPQISRNLVRLACRAIELDSAQIELSKDLVSMAIKLSPDFPEGHLAMSKLATMNGLSPGLMLKSYSGEIAAELSNFEGTRALLFRHALGFLIITLVVGLMLALALMARHGKCLAHDLGHLMPPGVTSRQKLVILLLALCAPLLADLGVVVFLMIVFAAFWAYSTAQERVAISIMLCLFLAWPVANKFARAGLVSSDNMYSIIAECNEGVCSESKQIELEKTRLAGNRNAEVDFTLGLTSYRKGAFDSLEIDRAQAFLSGFVTVGDRKIRAKALTLLGNIQFLYGIERCTRAGNDPKAGTEYFNDAKRYYTEATKLDSGLVEPLYNNGRLHAYFGDFGTGDGLIEKARGVDLGRVLTHEEYTQFAGQREFLCSSKFNSNRELMSPVLRTKDLYLGLVGSQPHYELPMLNRIVLGPLKVPQMAIAAMLLIVILILSLTFISRLSLARPCLKCGAVSCASCKIEQGTTGLCQDCLLYKIRGSFVDPKDLWHREKQMENTRKEARTLRRSVSFFVPGLGQLLHGSSVTGLVFFTLFFYPLLSLVFAEPLQPEIKSLSGALGIPTTQIVIYSVVCLVTYLVSLLDVYARD